ncbi:hypothetical protein QBC32DRAFT_396771 [Pseudoneurospora amorphoporcata]|uniref:DUF7587 domain-containing protein n=1 Tax=Pseudoneurospora amorphoporcata TaxID=241081 RepID=A0AAN6SGS9_9PEZI|nr:hypothetical protein QBC32DRAFT_396771 [Pseudoneurospora amorphoporcata]
MTTPAVFWHLASPDEPVVSLTLPPKLFHVRHGRSEAYETEDGGLSSRAPDRNIRHQEELIQNAEKHFRWGTRGWASCFVSAFGDQAHAKEWGRLSCLSAPVKVYELDTAKLPPGTLVLNAFMMCASLGISHSFNKNKDEYLFYRVIPGSCVERCWDPWDEDCPFVRVSNMATQEHGAVVECQRPRPNVSVSLFRREREAKKELERQKAAELNGNNTLVPVQDADINDLTGQMEVLDLETEVDNHISTSHESPYSTTSTASDSPSAATTRTRLTVSETKGLYIYEPIRPPTTTEAAITGKTEAAAEVGSSVADIYEIYPRLAVLRERMAQRKARREAQAAQKEHEAEERNRESPGWLVGR